MGAVAVAATAAVVALVLRGERKDETVIAFVEQPDATNRVNVSEVLDARGRRDVQAAAGRRYRAIIDGESRDSAAGVAHLGGLVTFVPDTRPGEDVLIEVTRVKQSTAEAVVVERLGAASPPAPGGISARTEGPVFTGQVESVGRKGDGIVKRDGKVVFVPGVQQGDEVVFAIVEEREKHSVGRLISRAPGAVAAAAPAEAAPKSESRKTDIAQPGDTFEVVVADVSRDRPGDGVARVQGLVVFVPDTKPGDHVRIRIVRRMARSAVGEVIERLPAAGPGQPAP
jgi:predicted RNA-binding protein with TRAM domain